MPSSLFAAASPGLGLLAEAMVQRNGKLTMQHDEQWLLNQPSYLGAMLSPKSLDGYKPKNASIPKWLDFWLYGPPEIRSSDPSVNWYCWLFAMVFGRTEHDATWNNKKHWQAKLGLRGAPKKGAVLMSFNSACLIFMYILFLFVPFHQVYTKGIKPYRARLAGEGALSEAPSAKAKPSGWRAAFRR